MLNQKLTGQQAADKTYIEDVFSTYLYTGKAETQVINNGIDLAGKGGMVWCKARSQDARNNVLIDTNRGIYYPLFSNLTDASNFNNDYLTSVSSTGFSLRNDGYNNQLNQTYASWTFRKAPKFFDVVTYTGNGASNRVITHNLGVAPGMIITKCTSFSGTTWAVYHRAIGTNKYLQLEATNAVQSVDYYTATSSTTYTLGSAYLDSNANGFTYVAYLFAHDTTTDGLIQCGSYTGNSSTAGPTVTLGWEPQYVMVKNATGATGWRVIDNMRGMAVTSNSMLEPNTSAAEVAVTPSAITPNATGFQITNTGAGYNSSGSTYIYMAIRRGPMRTPTDGTKVFSPTLGVNCAAGGVMYNAGFPVDTTIEGWRGGSSNNAVVVDRLRGNYDCLVTSSTNAAFSDGGYRAFDSNSGLKFNIALNATGLLNAWNFRRAPGFFDVVCYTGTKSGSGTQIVPHNLGVAPELTIHKQRNGTSSWFANTEFGASQSRQGTLNGSGALPLTSYATNDLFASKPTVNQLEIGWPYAPTSQTFVVYLFASCPGVSKVGSFTYPGSLIDIDCGFTNGARFVLIKRTDGLSNWFVFDTARGITTSTSDPTLYLNLTAAEASLNFIDPYPQGFRLSGSAPLATNGQYIYLAIA